ncbi:MAG: two-component system sensor histidine kinase NtrB [Myxococcota bacterium]
MSAPNSDAASAPVDAPRMARDLSGVLDSVLAGIVVLDHQRNVELANAAACRILGQSAQAIVGRPVEGLLGAEHALAELARSVLATGRSAAMDETEVERRFDRNLTVDVAAAPLFDDTGQRDGVVIFLRDSTIQRSLQEVVNERESLSAFGRIAAGVAHEVKNPLGGIRGAAELLAARASDGKTIDAAALIMREVDRITALVDDMMLFTQSEAARLAPANIHRVLDDVLELLTMDPLCRGVELRRLYDPSIPDVLVDADRLTQVFLNLCRNALQAMEGEGGTLTISTGMRLDRRITTTGGQQYPALRVEIADTGPGIAPDVIDKLATPFFTTRVGGTGLGLALSRHWLARHDGTLRIESRPGEGTQVRVDLPLRREDR